MTMSGSIWNGVFLVLRVSLLVYLALLVLVAGCQRRLIYFPSVGSESELLRSAGGAGLAAWRNGSGSIIGWEAASTAPAGPDADSFLVFHGNAGCALDRHYLSVALGGQNRGRVLLFEYPGYGARPGKPSEKAFAAAAVEALAQLRKESRGRIFLVGESIGSGVACRMAGDHPDLVAGVLLVTPFTSLTDVACHHYPLLPVRLLLRDRYDNVKALRAWRGPLAVLLAGRDEVVTTELGRRLYDSYAGPKQLWVQKERGHNDLDYSPFLPVWTELTGFLSSAKEGAK